MTPQAEAQLDADIRNAKRRIRRRMCAAITLMVVGFPLKMTGFSGPGAMVVSLGWLCACMAFYERGWMHRAEQARRERLPADPQPKPRAYITDDKYPEADWAGLHGLPGWATPPAVKHAPKMPWRFKVKHRFRRCIQPWCWRSWHHMQRCDRHARNGLFIPPPMKEQL